MAKRYRARAGANGYPNGTGKVRYAVVGLGNIAQVAALPAFAHARENSEVVALISHDRQKRETLRRKYRAEETGGFGDIEKVFERAHIQAAYLSVPNAQHRAFAERILRLGVHVLCEKPMAMTAADCRSMIATARAHHAKLMVAYRLHFDPGNLNTIALLASRKLGQPSVFSSTFSHRVRQGDIRRMKAAGGGGLLDLGVYCVNAARYLFRAEPIEAFAIQTFSGRPSTSVDQVTAATLLFPGDRIAQFTVSQDAAGVSSYRVIGSKGDARLEGAYDYASGMRQYATTGDDTEERSFRKHDQFAAELVYFSRCILEDREPEPSGEEGLADVRILEAIARSARTGKRISIPPASRKRRPRPQQSLSKPPVAKPRTIHAPSPSVD